VEVFQLLSRWSDQHVTHEESVIGASAHHADAYPVALVPAGKSIDDVDAVPGVEVVNGTFTVDSPDLVNLLARETGDTREVFSPEDIVTVVHADAGQPSPRRGTCKDRAPSGIPLVCMTSAARSRAKFLRTISAIERVSGRCWNLRRVASAC
jgi:hypothetical protein